MNIDAALMANRVIGTEGSADSTPALAGAAAALTAFGGAAYLVHRRRRDNGRRG